MLNKFTVKDIRRLKEDGQKIPMVTAYDYTTSLLMDQAGIPIILVGDSLGMVVLGFDCTIPVTMDDMIHHTKAVVRGAKKALIIADLPFMSYQIELTQAISNAARLVQEGGANAVKLEGGQGVADIVQNLVDFGIPVMGHIGLTPQSINQLGGYSIQGKDEVDESRLVQDALALEKAGAFALVLELIPSSLAQTITSQLSIPTIGIGAGPYCDGQVQVFHDMFGFCQDGAPRHARQYANLGKVITESISTYIEEVKNGSFGPTSS